MFFSEIDTKTRKCTVWTECRIIQCWTRWDTKWTLDFKRLKMSWTLVNVISATRFWFFNAKILSSMYIASKYIINNILKSFYCFLFAERTGSHSSKSSRQRVAHHWLLGTEETQWQRWHYIDIGLFYLNVAYHYLPRKRQLCLEQCWHSTYVQLKNIRL